MEIGPRIMTLIVIAGVWSGFRNANDNELNLDFDFDFDAALQTIMAANPINWCLRLVTESMEEEIMRVVTATERYLWDMGKRILCICLGCIMASLNCIVAWWTGRPFPPVIDV